MDENDLTLPEKILLVADSATHRTGFNKIRLESLIIECWKAYPETFGLDGFEAQYPDSNRVSAAMAGKRGVVARGWMEPACASKTYRVTANGKRVAAVLMAPKNGTVQEPKSTGRIKLSQQQSTVVKRWFDSDAWYKFANNRQRELTYSDACRFWGVSDSGFLRTTRLMSTAAMLDNLEKLLDDDGEAITTSNRAVTAADVRNMKHLHSYLEGKFSARFDAAV